MVLFSLCPSALLLLGPISYMCDLYSIIEDSCSFYLFINSFTGTSSRSFFKGIEMWKEESLLKVSCSTCSLLDVKIGLVHWLNDIPLIHSLSSNKVIYF